MNKDQVLEKALALLERYKLKKTDLRVQLLELFLKGNSSYSQADIIEKLGNVDRVSVYRNLLQLKEAGIVHEIENNRYVCCNHDCGKHAHVLLYCQSCEKHNEIKDHSKISDFFKMIGHLNFLSPEKAVFLKGLCETCAKK